VFFEEMRLPAPQERYEVGGSTRGGQIGEATTRLDASFGERRPRAVVVQGDTNAVAAGALAANAGEIPLVHIEAGLRSYDRRMPEEHNRVIADHLADLCCAPTEVNRANLAAEGITGERVVVTGNTVVEAVGELLPPAEERSGLLDRYGVARDEFVLATVHRPENVDRPGPLSAILTELAALSMPVLLPLHPRTAGRIEEFGLGAVADQLRIVPPLAYRPFLALMAEAALVISDSGGLQEEVSVLKRPIVVVRRSTERPEVQGTFADLVLPGPELRAAATKWLEDVPGTRTRLATVPSPYGDGSASQRSVAAIATLVGATP
jgi:UDP-N-acetylglucosamine 2-epimerase (non-hydrolysing)